MITEQPDHGELVIENGIAKPRLQSFFDAIVLFINQGRPQTYTVITVPDATKNESQIIYVSDESGGATLAFSDGTNWRRVQDRAIIS